MSRLDLISLEIFSNALRSITDETFVALMKSAYSTNIKERHDHSTAIMDARGNLIAQAENSLPIHLASMEGLMRNLLRKYGENIREGDLFVANDPHVAGGTHLPDINLAMPVFGEGRLLGFVANIAHHADVGGMAPGSMSGGMTEIYQEGLRLPVMRLFDQGELDEELLELILLNVRLPVERRGDYYAQIAACRLGARRLAEVVTRYGTATTEAGFGQILERSAERMRRALAGIPDGTYTFRDAMDDDGVGNEDLAIAVTVTARAGEISFNFDGTCPQTPGNVNCTMNATVAAVTYAIKALLDPDAPNTQSVIESVKVTAPAGCLINCSFPAPVAGRAHTCQRIIDVILGALADALPDRVTAAPNGANTMAVFSGIHPGTGQGYVYLETVGGGGGARATKNGKDGVQTGITNTSNLPVEAIEQEYPLLVEEYGLVPGSGGKGKFYGGRGIRRVVR
ncbi:MAG TPA: hydantoinase B/oxoprolinase family protein, partial [Alphaproteobacteria bacterium]|nr:hydantoinase B/oxoprolinase family protein [Alphaproteobacteria bacterium]